MLMQWSLALLLIGILFVLLRCCYRQVVNFCYRRYCNPFEPEFDTLETRACETLRQRGKRLNEWENIGKWRRVH